MSSTKEAAAALGIAAIITGTSVEALPSQVEPTPQSETAKGVMDSAEAITEDKKEREETEEKASEKASEKAEQTTEEPL